MLKRVDLEFTDKITDIISLLKIINLSFSMKGADYLTCKRTVELLVLAYGDDNFRKVINAIRYSYSTKVKLDELLTRLDITNSCLKIIR